MLPSLYRPISALEGAIERGDLGMAFMPAGLPVEPQNSLETIQLLRGAAQSATGGRLGR
jgi:hypothetical protein